MTNYRVWTQCRKDEHLKLNCGVPDIVLAGARSWAEAKVFQRHIETAYGDTGLWITDDCGRRIPPEGLLKEDYRVESEMSGYGALIIQVRRRANTVFEDGRPVPDMEPVWEVVAAADTEPAPEGTLEHTWVMKQLASIHPQAIID